MLAQMNWRAAINKSGRRDVFAWWLYNNDDIMFGDEQYGGM